MIISVAIVTGFQQQIREKVIGFGSHIQVSKYSSNLSYEPEPIRKDEEVRELLKGIEGVNHIQVYGLKAGILKTDDQIQGVVLKGVSNDYNWSFFNDKIVDGVLFTLSDTAKSNSIMISRVLADKLEVGTNDEIRMYFIIDNKTRGRKFIISGIYETGLEDFDNTYIFGDIGHIQKLNGWNSDQVTGFELLIDDFNDIDRIGEEVYMNIDYNLDAQTIKQLYPQMFDWLELQDMNVVIILILMVVVAGITMISTLLILILERTNMIGILKALGAKNWSIRKVFLFNAAYLIGIGLFWGNIIGIGLCLIQKYFGVIKLPQESYYVAVVPININIFDISILNLGTLIVCSLMLLIPSYIITRISPVRAIRFN